MVLREIIGLYKKIRSYEFSKGNKWYIENTKKEMRSTEVFLEKGEIKKEYALYRAACEVCGNADYQEFLRGVQFRYVVCKNCGYVWMNPCLEESVLKNLYKQNDIYNDIWLQVEANAAIQKNPEHEVLKEILRYRQRGALLDIGCGNGSLLAAAKGIFNPCEGIEPHSLARELAIQKSGSVVYDQPIEKLQLDSESYDIIVLSQVIEHLPYPSNIISELYRILKKGGIVFISCPNVTGLSFRLFGMYHTHISSWQHINLFSPKTMRMLCEKNGFKVVDIFTQKLDIPIWDLIYYPIFKFRKKGEFWHRYNSQIPFLRSASSVVDRQIEHLFDYSLRRSSLGSYVTCVFEK